MAARRFLAIGECMIEFSQANPPDWRMGFAGDTLNASWYFRAATALSDWEVEYFTRLGRDRFSDRMIAFLSENGIGTRFVSRDPVRNPGLYLIDVDKGERSFTYWRRQSAARLLADDEAALRQAILGSDVVLFSGITLAILAPDRRERLIALAGEARQAGRLVAFDPNIRPRLWEDAGTMRAAITAAAASASLLLPSLEDEATHFGDRDAETCIERYRKAGCGEIVVKNGGGPVSYCGEGACGTVADLERVEPVDTTGAGDSFNGAYLAGRAAGDGMEQAIRRAHDIACRVVRRHGALVAPHLLA